MNIQVFNTIYDLERGELMNLPDKDTKLFVTPETLWDIVRQLYPERIKEIYND